MLVGTDAGEHVGHGAETFGVAVDDALAQRACIAFIVLNSDSNTDRNAAVPVAPAFGGKLNTTAATLRCARSERRRSTSLPTRAASASARSTQLCMSWASATFSNLQAWAQPVQAMCWELPRPPNTIEPVAPSSSGMATIIVASTGNRPRGDAPHWSSVWNSTGVTAI
jgi:hypothetical protein